MQLLLAQATNEPTGGVAGWALDLIDSLGAVGLALLSALDSMTSVLPVDLLLPLVGYSATQGGILIATAIACATAGSVTGFLVMYAIGARLGNDRARAALTKIPGIKAEGVDRAEAWFTRHGTKAVLFGRILPGVRCFISIPAGVHRMPLPKYVLFSALGSLIWNSTLLLSGYLLGENWHRITDAVGMLPYILIGVTVVAAPIVLIKRRRRRQGSVAEVSSASPVSPGRSGRRRKFAAVFSVPSVLRRCSGRQGEAAAVSSASAVSSARSHRRRKIAAVPSVPAVLKRRGPRRRRFAALLSVPAVLRRRSRRQGEVAADMETIDENVEVTQP
ncbi:DedA family protein [Streptomyces sp. NPDC047061]|uniref:DedA family protein n=1 Tax=Streptomyces sp. NPDC047061 TaxID=3154605 RepID=UPI0033F268B4